MADAVVPGDRIVVPLDPDVPQRAEIVAGIVDSLLSAGIDAANITILQACGSTGQESLAAQLLARGTPVQIEVHAPQDPSQLAYLAASKDAQPIMLHRLLCEADLVLPVNLLRPIRRSVTLAHMVGSAPPFPTRPRSSDSEFH